MTRKGRGGQQLNSSVISITGDADQSLVEQDYAEFVARFEGPEQLVSSSADKTIEFVGYQQLRESLRARIDLFVNRPQARSDILLLSGPSGTGKTSLLAKLARETEKLNYFYLHASWTLERQFSEARLRSMFLEARRKAPSLIFIDKLDLICAEKRSQNDSARVYNTLLYLMERLNSIPCRVMLVAATNRAEVLDAQIRDTCYFSDEIKFTLPSKEDRLAIIRHIIEKSNKQISDNHDSLLKKLVDASHCFSYVDLSKLINIAVDRQADSETAIAHESIDYALKQFKPHSLTSITTPCPALRWSDIGGVEEVKTVLQESVIWPLQHRHLFKRLGIPSIKGAILYGPPGCSKTMLAQALATESGYNFVSFKGPQLLSKYVGESEAAVRRLYKNAREIAPCIIFFDEIDGFVSERNDNQSSSVSDKVVTTLLAELNGIEPLDNVFTIAATNRPDRVDSALLRPGRLDPAIYIPLPSKSDRCQIFRVHLEKMSCKFDDYDDESLDTVYKRLANKTSHYSGAEIANVCRVAGALAIRESFETEHIEWRHLEAALDKVKPRTRPDQLKIYEQFLANSRQSNSTKGKSSAKSTPTTTVAQQMRSSSSMQLYREQQQQSSTKTLNRLMRSFTLRGRAK